MQIKGHSSSANALVVMSILQEKWRSHAKLVQVVAADRYERYISIDYHHRYGVASICALKDKCLNLILK